MLSFRNKAVTQFNIFTRIVLVFNSHLYNDFSYVQCADLLLTSRRTKDFYQRHIALANLAARTKC